MTYDRFPFSNTISDTITASVATFSPTTGPDKYSGITLTNANLSGYANGNYGSCAVSATTPAINTKFWIEWKPDSSYTGTGGGLTRCGFYDGSLDLSNQVAVLPGSSSTAPNGITLTAIIGGTSVAYARNGIAGGSNNWALPGGVTWAAGDWLHPEVDQSTNTVVVKFWDASASTGYTLGTLALTSKIPSQWVFFSIGGKGHAGVRPPATASPPTSAHHPPSSRQPEDMASMLRRIILAVARCSSAPACLRGDLRQLPRCPPMFQPTGGLTARPSRRNGHHELGH
jgi:hypothetical protein